MTEFTGSLPQNWYIVRTRTSFERKVKESILLKVKNLSLENKIFQVIVPTEEIIKIKKNKKNITQKPYFSGYVFVDMILDQDTYWIVRNTPGVSGFLGGDIPAPLSDEEKRSFIDMITKPMSKPKPAVTFDRNETVRIIDGPFKHFMAVVDDINEERGKLKVMVTIFGRPTPFELDFFQVEKV
jgi:transcriptional antiterminator NusG